jgi:DNA-binding transcriptional MerR regulator
MRMRVKEVGIRRSPHLETGEVAQLIGSSKQTVLNWLRAGWIEEPSRNQKNNYRMWTEHDVTRIREMLRERNLDKARHRQSARRG